MRYTHSRRRLLLAASSEDDDDSNYQSGGSSVKDGAKEDQSSESDRSSDNETSGDEETHDAEFYRAHAEMVNNAPIERIYAERTTLQLGRVETEWRKYCDKIIRRPPVQLMESITLGDISSFFTWKLKQEYGAKKRILPGIKKASSLATYRKTFLGVYRKLTGKDMDSILTKKTLNLTKILAREHKLSYTPREKASIDARDMLMISQTALTTVEKKFKVGRYRIQLCFFMQGGFITANRPDALLRLRYKDIKVTVLRHPTNSEMPHSIVLEFKYEFTKSFMGDKPASTFVIPEILFDPSLVMSPHVFLLGLMFADKVFLNPELTPELLLQLKIRNGCQSLEVPIKKEMEDVYVFRQCGSTAVNLTTTREPLKYSTIKAHMKDVGEITGFKQIAKPYCLRYGSGNAFDADGGTSDALRNLIMKHSNTKVFLDHYLSSRISTDTQAIVRGTAPQDELMQAACRMSRWVDVDRPRCLTTEQSESLDQDDQIQKLLQRRERCKGKSSQQEKYRKLTRDIRNKRQQLKYGLRKEIRESWDTEQAVKDIQQQLSGEVFSEKMKEDLIRPSDLSPQHASLIESIMSLPGGSLDEENLRRSNAIRAIAKYCSVEEGRTRRSRPEALSDGGRREEVDALQKAFEAAKTAVKSEKRPKICFLCLGDEKKPMESRIHSFYTRWDLSKHFENCHLKRMHERQEQECKICSVKLKDKTDLKLHAFVKHGTVPKKDVPQEV